MPRAQLETYLREARRIAQLAGDLLLARFELLHEMEFKGDINPVTDADKLSEGLVTGEFHKHFPDHAIIAEEGTVVESKSPYCWIIDPLDGTTNYAHRFPIFGISIALLEEGKPVVGVIVAPKLGEEYHALKGRGAFLNGKPIHVSTMKDLGRSFLATGEPYDVRVNPDYHMELVKRFIQNSLAVRRAGAACLDLAQVACGRFEGYWEAGLKPWDVAAGMLLVEEAGGKISEYSGNPYVLKESPNLVASNGKIHSDMIQILGKAPVESGVKN